MGNIFTKHKKIIEKKKYVEKDYPNYCRYYVKRDPEFIDKNAVGICSIW